MEYPAMMTTKEGKFPALDKLDEDAREQDYLADVDVDAFLAEADAGPDDPERALRAYERGNVRTPFAFHEDRNERHYRVGTDDDLKANNEWRAQLFAAGHSPHLYEVLIVDDGATLVWIDSRRKQAQREHRESVANWHARRREFDKAKHYERGEIGGRRSIAIRAKWARENPFPKYVDPFQVRFDPTGQRDLPADIVGRVRFEFVTDGTCEHACEACINKCVEVQDDDMSRGIFDSNEAISGRIADVQDHIEERITAAVNDVLHDAKRTRLVDIAVFVLVALVLVIVIAVLAGCTN